MSNDITSGNSKFKYEWNPFQDILDNRIEKELIHCDGPANPIIAPRCFPFFAKNFKIFLKGSTTPLNFEDGDYSFVYPYMTFVVNYQNLVYGGIKLNKVTGPTDYEIYYDTIGSDYVLDDVNYAQFVANIINNPRTANIEQIVNFPAEFPPDPHDHPAVDTFSYTDMIVWMKSYLDALVGINVSLTLAKQFTDHINQDIQLAHKASLSSLGIKNLQDLPMADSESIKGESSQVIGSVWAIKTLIRQFNDGIWK